MDQDYDLVRIRRLERLLAVTLFLAIVPWFVLGALAWKFSGPRIEFSKVLVAPGFEVVKPDGTTAARLSTEHDAGHLALHSPEGAEFAVLGQGPSQGGALALRGATRANAVWLGCDKSDGGNLTLRNKANETVVVVSDNEGQGGGFAARRGDDRLIAFVGAGTKSVGALELYDDKGRALVFLGQDEEDQGSLLKMRGADSKSLAVLQVEKSGGELNLYDDQGALRAFLGAAGDGREMLDLFNRAGERTCLIGETETLHGGLIQAYAPGDKIAFCAGVDSRDGAGILSLNHPSGPQIFAAGMSDDGSGGILQVHDVDGKMILRAP